PREKRRPSKPQFSRPNQIKCFVYLIWSRSNIVALRKQGFGAALGRHRVKIPTAGVSNGVGEIFVPAKDERRIGMELAAEFVAWECIGCGRIEGPQPCIGVCQDRKVSFVYASDYAAVLSRLLEAEERIAALEGLIRRMALSTPRTGEWERSCRSLQEEARRGFEGMREAQAIDGTPAREKHEEQ